MVRTESSRWNSIFFLFYWKIKLTIFHGLIESIYDPHFLNDSRWDALIFFFYPKFSFRCYIRQAPFLFEPASAAVQFRGVSNPPEEGGTQFSGCTCPHPFAFSLLDSIHHYLFLQVPLVRLVTPTLYSAETFPEGRYRASVLQHPRSLAISFRKVSSSSSFYRPFRLRRETQATQKDQSLGKSRSAPVMPCKRTTGLVGSPEAAVECSLAEDRMSEASGERHQEQD